MLALPVQNQKGHVTIVAKKVISRTNVGAHHKPVGAEELDKIMNKTNEKPTEVTPEDHSEVMDEVEA